MLEHLPGRIVTTGRGRYTIQGVYAAFPPETEDAAEGGAPRLRFSTADRCCCEVEGEDRSRWLAEVGGNDEATLIRRLD